MTEKTVSTRMSIVGRGVNCRGGKSAVEQSAYISRTTQYSEYYAQTYYPKYTEDLVHTEILLPDNAPESFSDRAVLWNSVEAVEKHSKAQLARLYKVSLPNSWSEEIAAGFMQDYINRNFVSQGMCAEYAIHNSVNKDGVHNLHCHILLTMRPLRENGEWGDKQKKIYKYDVQGNKIRKRNGRYDCTTVKTTDWDNKDNARKWRKDLVEHINTVNEKIGNNEVWEWQSFKERGLDQKPTIHLGEQATALERQGIHTDKGDYNRDVRLINSLDEKLRRIKAAEEAEKEATPPAANKDETPVQQHVSEIAPKEKDKCEMSPTSIGQQNVRHTPTVRSAIKKAAGEVMEFLHKVARIRGKLSLPVSGAKYLAMIKDRKPYESIQAAERFITDNGIATFTQLERYIREHSSAVDQTKKRIEGKLSRMDRLEAVTDAYKEYAPIRDIMKKRDSLSAFARMKYEKEHKAEIERFPGISARFLKLKGDDLKVTPKAWEKEISTIKAEISPMRKRYVDEISNLAIAEVIQYTRRDILRTEQLQRGEAYGQRLKQTGKPEHMKKSFRDILDENRVKAEQLNEERHMQARSITKNRGGKTL